MTNNQMAISPQVLHLALACRGPLFYLPFRLPVGPERPRWLYQSQTVYTI